MSIKLYFYALLVFALSSSVIAPPPPVQPARTPQHMSQWRPLQDYPYINSLEHMWYRVERVPLSAEAKKRNLDDVITFKVDPLADHSVTTGVTAVWRSTLIRRIVKKETDSEQCEARRGTPRLKNFQHVPISDGNILVGTWALTEHFNPSGGLLFPSETSIIEMRSDHAGNLEVRHLPVEEKQDHFAMAQTCEEKELGVPGLGAFVNQLLFT